MESLGAIDSEINKRDIKRIRWKAHVSEDYNFRLYHKLANLMGVAFNVYGASSYVFESTPERLKLILRKYRPKSGS